MQTQPTPARGADRPPETLFSSHQIASRVDELAAEISRDYADSRDLILVGVLRGAFIFLADLARRLTVPRQVDFIAVASYDGTDQRDGAVRMIMDLRVDIAGRDVLIVEDIIDTGRTIEYLQQTLAARGAASIRTCSFLKKPARHLGDPKVDYYGFEIPDAWVVGYGLDLADRFRTLPYIGTVDPDAIDSYDG